MAKKNAKPAGAVEINPSASAVSRPKDVTLEHGWFARVGVSALTKEGARRFGAGERLDGVSDADLKTFELQGAIEKR